MTTQDISQHKYLFHKGTNYRSYEFLGAHRVKADTYAFRVWAPRAAGISLVGNFNGWDASRLPFRRLPDDDSIWEITVGPAEEDGGIRLYEGEYYKFAVRDDRGNVVYKADPYAFMSEATPFEEGGQRASCLWDISRGYDWGDGDYLAQRRSRNPYISPMNIYEVHIGSWRRREDGSRYSYRELADLLIPYVVDMGYTHIELLPVMEHPYEGSWGYQVTGYYSVMSKYGTPDDFRYLIDTAHRAGIGVILDWVPAHFPRDGHGLIEFDGYPLYEYDDILKREHKGWGTLAFDYGRPEVVSFLVSNAFYYCDCFHADGLRVDAVSAMLYLNYGRSDGEWYPNEDGGTENKEAIRFLQTLNQSVLSECPGVLMIAEEATAFPCVTKPPQTGGLGFNFKWNMGWMNDTLDYFATDPLFRKGVHNKLTFSLTYAFSENFILPISHDEVVHGKHSLLDKMPGSYEDKFSGFRAFMVYMMTHPGKKLNFMGSEFAQFIEWNENQGLDWVLMLYPKHKMIHDYVRALNHLYRETPAFWCQDDSFENFRWIDPDNSSDNVYTYLRVQTHENGKKIADKKQPTYLIILNLSGNDYKSFGIGVPCGKAYKCLVHSEDKLYGGSVDAAGLVCPVHKGALNGYPDRIEVDLPKLSGMILRRI
ncbi:MAG: 1,4-alpha-glucan branching protein GlgB [Mogibacterium sp.]|nr:1,4-alpha-glucan branching protein GlgB [Mogibacterium sp.]